MHRAYWARHVHGSPPTVFPVAPRTLLGASELLATPQEDRHDIRAGQDPVAHAIAEA